MDTVIEDYVLSLLQAGHVEWMIRHCVFSDWQQDYVGGNQRRRRENEGGGEMVVNN